MSIEVAIRRKWKDFSLEVEFSTGGGALGILGASGCGKSMTLKSIAGIERPDGGRIAVGGRVLFDAERAVDIPPQKRNVGYLFQNYALFPHMRVAENIACALGGVPRAQRAKRVEDMLRRLHLEGLGERYPSQLSGGQQQRVALARSLAREPGALLLDEPFSALDTHLRERLQREMAGILGEYPGDVVIVTHSRDEVYQLCDRLVVMEEGRCIASGETKELFRRPGLLSVARLTGCKNISAALPLGKHRLLATDWGVELETEQEVAPDADHVGLHDHALFPAGGAGAANAFAAQTRERLESPFGWNILISPAGAKAPLWWRAPRETGGAAPEYLAVAPGDVLPLRTERSVSR